MAKVETRREDGVGIITLNRPEALNAIDQDLMNQMLEAAANFDADDAVGALVVTGSGEKAFAAGADIAEMAEQSFVDMFSADLASDWERFAGIRKPVVAAVNGLALGGGCEVVLMCDIVIAAETARFGLPEIKLGVIPGWGGTQRLTRTIGKARAMDMILTGRLVDAREAERLGFVSRVVETAALMDEALSTARQIASRSCPAAMLAKEAVNRANEMSLQEGLRFERRAFHSTFATLDQKEGMSAFLQKRPPAFRNR